MGRSSDGFLLGLIIGGGLTLLLTTKKGNKILKVVAEEGLEGLNQYLEEVEKSADDYLDEKVSESEVEGFSLHDQDIPSETNGHAKTETNGHSEVSEVKPHKRFFRRSRG